MLGSAPGTDRLNDWVDDLDDDMSVEDLANHIEDSDDFQDEYPAFMTDGEFAEAFMGNLLGDYATADVSAMVVEAVEGLLGAGHSRGEVALVVVTAMLAIAAEGESHDLYEALGMASTAFHNKVMVAEHYTVMARMEDPSASVLEGVTADADSAMMAIDAIDNSLQDAPMGETFVLTATRDDWEGTDQGDTIIAEPVAQVSNVFIQTLQPFDVIDGGDGMDTLYIYDVDGTNDFDISNADVSNVEHVVVNAQAGITADMSQWAGLETVDLRRFASNRKVDITVDGAMVMTDRTYGGESVEINGSAGALELMAGSGTAVMVGSAGQTTSVMVKGGSRVMVHNGKAGADDTVTAVSVDGVASDARPSITRGATVTPDPRVDDPEDRKPTVEIHSDAIGSLSLANTFGTVLVANGSGEAQDLMITVNKYGGQKVDHDGDSATAETPTPPVAQAGKICLDGSGSAEIIMIDVAGDSHFDLATNTVKMIDIMGDGKLNLDVNKFKEDAPDDGPSTTLSEVEVGGGVSLTMNTAGHTALMSVDASGSSGNNKITTSAAEKALTSIMTGSGGDTVNATVADDSKLASISSGAGADKVTVTGARKAGITVDLGAGNDTYTAGADNDKTRVDGGDGMDTLNLLNGSGATYKAEGSDTAMSIYSGFETLDAGGGDGEYDIRQLGVEAITFSKNTADGGVVKLDNIMKAGMGFSVHGATAMVDYNLAAVQTGSRFDAVEGGIFTIDMSAEGGNKDDAKAGTITGNAIANVKIDDNIELMIVNSTASVNSAKSTAGAYTNTICVRDDSLQEVKITGDAMVVLKDFSDGPGDPSDTGLNSLRFVDATGNSAGVTVTVGAANTGTDTTVNGETVNKGIDMRGGAGDDTFNGGSGNDMLMGNAGKDTLKGNDGMDTLHGGDGDDKMLDGGAGNDTLRGGAGADMLKGGTGDDKFEFLSVSDSSMGSHDVIKDFEDGANVIMLSSALFANANANIKTRDSANVEAEAFTVNNSATTANDANAHSLTALIIGNGNGFFETHNGESGLARVVTKNFVAIVEETMFVDTNKNGILGDTVDFDHDGDDQTADEPTSDMSTERTWILLDINGNGDFDADTDLVIELTGHDHSIGPGSFDEIMG